MTPPLSFEINNNNYFHFEDCLEFSFSNVNRTIVRGNFWIYRMQITGKYIFQSGIGTIKKLLFPFNFYINFGFLYQISTPDLSPCSSKNLLPPQVTQFVKGPNTHFNKGWWFQLCRSGLSGCKHVMNL